MKRLLMILCPECFDVLPQEIQHCSKCGWTQLKHNHVNIMLSKRDLNNPLFKSYLKNYDDIAAKDLETPFLQNRYIDIQADKIYKLLPILKGKDICDIGSGRGYLINKMISANPNSISAVDISLPYLEKINKNVYVFQANAENLPFKDRFDIITCTDVMEHVINVGGFLYSLNRALKLYGYAAIRVPYKENLLNYAPQNGCKYEFAHLRDFNRSNLKGLLSYAGFKIISTQIDSFSLQTPQKYWLKTQKRLDRYTSFQKFMRKRLPEDSDVNLYPSLLLRIFMRPLEITVLCKKITSIA